MGPRAGTGSAAIVEVFEDGVIDHELVVQPDTDAGSDHDDAERVPFAEWFVGEHEGILAGRTG
jgi:hypothetical protein